MGEINQTRDPDGGSERASGETNGGSKWVTDYSLSAATITYALLSVPVYFWLEGPVGTAGTVDASVTLAGLALGAILFVPILKAVLTNRVGASRVHPGGETD